MIKAQKVKKQKKQRRKARVRAKISGTSKIPRLTVFRSLKHISAQLIDDDKGKTLISAQDTEIKTEKGKKMELAIEVGKLLAKKAQDKKIKRCIFDKSLYKYHGRIKALAEGARQGGLEF